MILSASASRRERRDLDGIATQPIPVADPDLDLVHVVTQALAAATDVDPAGVHVSADEGRISLRGMVGTHAERLAASTLVGAVAGVIGVENFLRVRGIEMTSVGYDDETIAEGVGRAILDSTIRVDGLSLDVSQHVVTIRGQVATKKDETALRHAVQHAPGVHFVDNHLEVEGRQMSPVIEDLEPAECFRLIQEQSIGRLAVQDETGVDVFPVNYVLHDNAIYFRSAPGTKMIRLTDAPHVAFEIDSHGEQESWSVVVRGVAHRLDSDEEILASGISEAHSAHPSEKFNYVRIRPQQITGRRFRVAHSEQRETKS